jgi:hypothetical protein
LSSEGLKLLEMLHAHVGCGAMKPDDLDRMARIDALSPDGCRYAGGDVWRVMKLDAEQYADLEAGRNIVLTPREHSCWSKDPVAIMKVQRHRAETMVSGECMIRMKQHIASDRAAVDIEQAFRDLCDTEGLSWGRYASQEREIILRHDGGSFTITPDMVDRVWPYGDFDVGTPLPGEELIGGRDLSEDPIIIEEVIEAYNGGWVVASGGKHYEIHWDFGELSGFEREQVPETPNF